MISISSNPLIIILGLVLIGSGIAIERITLASQRLLRNSDTLRTKNGNNFSYYLHLLKALILTINGIVLIAFDFYTNITSQLIFILLAPVSIWYAFESLSLWKKARNNREAE